MRAARARKFAAKYVLNGFNPVQAVVDCGITTNRNSAHVIGYRLLRNVTVMNEIEKHIRSHKLSADDVLEKLGAIGGKSFNIEEIRPEHALKALELSGKANKLFVDRVESDNVNHNNSDDLPSLYMKEAANNGVILTREEAQARIDAQLRPVSDEVPSTEAVN